MNITNARRAAIILAVNSALALAMSFGLPISDIQESAIIGFANAAMGLWVVFTYKDSPMRIPEVPDNLPEDDFA